MLDIHDLILELFRADNLDTSRPVRPSLGGSCAGGSGGNSIGTAKVTGCPHRRHGPEPPRRARWRSDTLSRSALGRKGSRSTWKPGATWPA